MPLRLRRSARVLLFDPEGDLLLIRFAADRNGQRYVFWVTPGGEVETGEGDREAAARELREELGLVLPLLGPVHVESGGEYTHLGETVRNHDVFFAARCGRNAPALRGVTQEELALMQEIRWWTPTDLAAPSEPVFPAAIATLAPAVLRLLPPCP